MKLFRRKRNYIIEDPSEQRFDAMMELIKDLPKSDYNRLKDAIDLGWNAYQKVRNVKTADEKENEDILSAEKAIVKEFKDDN